MGCPRGPLWCGMPEGAIVVWDARGAIAGGKPEGPVVRGMPVGAGGIWNALEGGEAVWSALGGPAM